MLARAEAERRKQDQQAEEAALLAELRAAAPSPDRRKRQGREACLPVSCEATSSGPGRQSSRFPAGQGCLRPGACRLAARRRVALRVAATVGYSADLVKWWRGVPPGCAFGRDTTMTEPNGKPPEPSQQALHFQPEWCRVTLASIGDAVMTTDNRGRITFLNAVAESLTGWTAKRRRRRPARNGFQDRQ